MELVDAQIGMAPAVSAGTCTCRTPTLASLDMPGRAGGAGAGAVEAVCARPETTPATGGGWRGAVRCAVRRPAATSRLICLPHAGASAAVYDRWGQTLPASMEVMAVQLPARGHLLLEKPYEELEPLVESLAREIATLADKPFALLGHSMGALIGFEVARELRRAHAIEPLALFASACLAPHLPRRVPSIHRLPLASFWDAIAELGGTPEEILGNAEVRQLVEPGLRADFALCETYRYRGGRPLGCPIAAYRGTSDAWVSEEDMQGWERHTSRGFTAEMISGGHFYIHTAHDAMTASVTRTLIGLASGSR